MRNALLSAGFLLALACAWWLARPAQRDPELPAGSVEEADETEELELAAPPVFAPGTETDDAVDEAGPRGAREKVAAAKALDRAPVRGRLVIRGTDVPIEAELPLRLRTIDLGVAESLTTRPDGTFTSTHHYRRGVLLALVRNAEGYDLVDHEALFDPRSEQEWLVPVPANKYPTTVRGRVVNARGDPVAQARVQLVPLRPLGISYQEKWSDENGDFELLPTRPGPCRLHVQGHWARAEPRELVLRAGPNELGEVLLLEPPAAGDFLVRVVPEGECEPSALVVVRDGSGLREQVVTLLEGDLRDDGSVELRIPDVPAGEYTVALEPLDGRGYEPAHVTVAPPAEIEFRVRGQASEGLRLRARDARTGEALTRFTVWFRSRGHWEARGPAWNRHPPEPSGEVLLGPTVDTWIVSAEGFRAQRGSGGSGTREVELERGWCELLVFEDVEGDSYGIPDSESARRRTELEGVEVWTDGRLGGRSGPDGLLVLEGEGAKPGLEFRLQGWRVVHIDGIDGMLRVRLAQSP